MFTYLKKAFVLSLVTLLFASCVAKVETQENDYKSCKLATSKMKLSYEKVESVNCGSDPKAAMACLALYGVIVPVGSAVASGSIVLVNNTIHWLEYQGKCDEDDLQDELKNMKKDLKDK